MRLDLAKLGLRHSSNVDLLSLSRIKIYVERRNDQILLRHLATLGNYLILILLWVSSYLCNIDAW